MALTPDVVAVLAERLDVAERERTQVDQFSAEHPDMTIPDAYEVQRAWVAKKIARGRRKVGRKIGLTSRAMQRSSNISEPDYGVLLDDMVFEGGVVPAERFIVPRVEVELAFILGRPVEGPDVTIFDVLSAAEYVVPAVEIIDARIRRVDPVTGATRKVVDTIADNAANAGIVLGGVPVAPSSIDLRWASALIYQNGGVEDSGVAGAVLGHPANGVAWLARKLAPYGERLEAGEIILGGSFTAPLPAQAGDQFYVDYGSLGGVTVRFE